MNQKQERAFRIYLQKWKKDLEKRIAQIPNQTPKKKELKIRLDTLGQMERAFESITSTLIKWEKRK